jgi:hypothetical protein
MPTYRPRGAVVSPTLAHQRVVRGSSARWIRLRAGGRRQPERDEIHKRNDSMQPRFHGAIDSQHTKRSEGAVVHVDVGARWRKTARYSFGEMPIR